ncbi:MAG: NAD-dependent epimerase/dehydratase family protein [Acidobacteria bacterium]|nr:NAD-dependent epimerase/dehydratase family protein [Acidobacteriota bacterium]
MAPVVGPPYGASVSGRKVFLTGANGLLGSWLAGRLLDLGAELTVLRREPQPTSALALSGNEDRCRVVDGDLLDAALLEEVLGDSFDVAIHLAAQAIVGVARRSPRSTFEVNVAGTWNVLEGARLGGVGRVVVASSDKAYGPSEVLPYTEDLPLRAQFPYDASKAAADMIARSYWNTYRLPVAVTRLANLYGGGDQNASRLVPEAMAAVLEGRRPVVRSDGSPERDYLYAEDAADAYLAVLDLLAAGEGAGEAFNAGSGVPRRAIDVVTEILRVAGSDLEPEVQGTGVPEGEIERQVIDSARLEAATGWKAATSLEDGLARTLDWYRDHPEALAS